MPQKLKDLGSSTIPCLTEELMVVWAFVDMGVHINLMPYKMFRRLRLKKPKPARISFQLVDRSVKFPTEVIGYMLVKVGNIIFLVDFMMDLYSFLSYFNCQFFISNLMFFIIDQTNIIYLKINVQESLMSYLLPTTNRWCNRE